MHSAFNQGGKEAEANDPHPKPKGRAIEMHNDIYNSSNCKGWFPAFSIPSRRQGGRGY